MNYEEDRLGKYFQFHSDNPAEILKFYNTTKQQFRRDGTYITQFDCEIKPEVLKWLHDTYGTVQQTGKLPHDPTARCFWSFRTPWCIEFMFRLKSDAMTFKLTWL